MSFCLEEDIKSLIPQEDEREPKVSIYHSKYSNLIRCQVQQLKKCHQTMGYAQIQLDPPTDFLKKKTRIVKRPYVDKSKPNFEPKAPVPPPKVKMTKNQKKEKNYKRENIIHVMRSVPKKPTPTFVDTTRGDSHKLMPSGLLPQYIFKQSYGKIPKYLLIRQKAAEEKDRVLREKEVEKKPTLRYITEDERQRLLEGLKKNWQDLQKEFQLLPMVTDTVPKIKRKTQLEKELKELEKDIQLIDRNPIIYVNENDRHKLRHQCKKTVLCPVEE